MPLLACPAVRGAAATLAAGSLDPPSPLTPLPQAGEGSSIAHSLIRHLFPIIFCLFPIACHLLAPGTAWAVERFPPPDFTDHVLPETQLVPPRAEIWQCVDVAFLALALAAAGWLTLRRRSRRGLLVLTIVSLVWLGFVREGCVCPIGAIQNVTLALADPGYAVPLSVIVFFTLPILAALLVGRAFCAAVCPLGAIQELVVLRPTRVPRWLEHALGLIPYVYLGAGVALAATGTALVICRWDPFVGLFRFGAPLEMLLWGGGLLLLGVFVGRPYCRYLCPYGAILGIVARGAKWRVRITPDECIQCRLCEETCPYEAIDEPTVAPPAEARPAARRRLVFALAAAPLLVALGAVLGRGLDVPLSRLDFTVRLAERLRAEEIEPAAEVEPSSPAEPDEMSEAVDAFRSTGRPVGELYDAAFAQRGRLRIAGVSLGGWVGLVIGVKLVHLSIRRRRANYTADPSRCVACGRCYWYCPREQVRRGLLPADMPGVALTRDEPDGGPRP